MAAQVDLKSSMSIGAVARRLGVATSTVRYWDDRGLVRSTFRNGGKRYYDTEAQHRLAVVKMLQQSGILSLDQLDALLNVGAGKSAWRRVIDERIAEIEAQIANLTDARNYLSHIRGCPRADPIADCERLRAMTDAVLESS